MSKKKTERKCKDCSIEFPYIPRRVRCVECYKKLTNFKDDTVEFIKDDD